MSFFAWYCVASLIIGLSCVLYELQIKGKTFSGASEKANARIMKEEIRRGNIQKEEYGERVVHIGTNTRGRGKLQASEVVINLEQNHRFIYAILMVLMASIVWPKFLYNAICKSTT